MNALPVRCASHTATWTKNIGKNGKKEQEDKESEAGLVFKSGVPRQLYLPAILFSPPRSHGANEKQPPKILIERQDRHPGHKKAEGQIPPCCPAGIPLPAFIGKMGKY